MCTPEECVYIHIHTCVYVFICIHVYMYTWTYRHRCSARALTRVRGHMVAMMTSVVLECASSEMMEVITNSCKLGTNPLSLFPTGIPVVGQRLPTVVLQKRPGRPPAECAMVWTVEYFVHCNFACGVMLIALVASLTRSVIKAAHAKQACGWRMQRHAMPY